MAPAIWANKEDIKMKQKAYTMLATMNRWPCQGLHMKKSKTPFFFRSNVSMPTAHTETLKTKTAKELCGMIPYDFKDGKCNGPDWTPEWRKTLPKFSQHDKRKPKLFDISYLALIGISVFVAMLICKFISWKNIQI